MSQENVDIVRQSIDAYNRRDIDAMRAVIDQDVELDWSASRGWVAGVYKGRAAVMHAVGLPGESGRWQGS